MLRDTADRLVFEFGRANPKRPALQYGTRTLSFGELDGLVGRTARHLGACGIRPGAAVGVALGNTLDHAVVLLACFRMGAVYVPIDWRARPEEAIRIHNDFGLTACLVEPGHRLDGRPGALRLDESWHRAVAATAPAMHDAAGGDDPLMINLSSGTTSRAKGAVATHAQYIRRMASYRRTLGAESGGRFLCFLPLSFSAGRNFLCYNLSIGNTVVIDGPLLGPPEIVERINRLRITSFFAPPVTIRTLLDLAEPGQSPFPGLKQLIAGTDKMTADEKREVAARLCPNFHMLYSTTATGHLATLSPADIAGHAESVGRINPDIEVQIVDDDRRPLPVGETGLVRSRGPQQSTEILGTSPGDVGDVLHDGWFCPGDIGRRDAEGFLYLVGRRAGLIVRRGVSVYPEEVEAVLNAHPAVGQAAVCGIDGIGPETEIAALIVARGPVTPAQLRQHCIPRLNGYKLPDHFLFVDELPRTGTGKIHRAELGALAVRRRDGRL